MTLHCCRVISAAANKIEYILYVHIKPIDWFHKIHVNSRKWSLPLHNNWSNSMLESEQIFECCNLVSDIYMQCTAVKPYSKYRRKVETHAEKFEHRCALRGWINTFQYFPVDSSFRGEGGKGDCNGSAGLFKKKWQPVRVMWTNSWLDCPGPGSERGFFLALWLHRVLYEFWLESHYFKILLVLSCSVALLTRQAKYTVTVRSKLSAGTLVEQVVPDQDS